MSSIKEQKFHVGGMSCASCVGRVEKIAGKLPGVESATVNLATETALIRFDSSLSNTDSIIEAINKGGYSAHLAEAKKSDVIEGDNAFLDEKLRLIISIILTLPLLLPMLFGTMLDPYLQLGLAAPVQFFIGYRFYVSAFAALRAKTGNMDSLVALGTTAAFALSCYQLAIGSHDLYFESSAVIITLVLLGKYLENRAKMQTGTAIRALQKLRPETARIKTKEGLKDIPIASVREGDLILIRPGESIPVDGEILEGEGTVDESMLTGESIPISKKVGEPVTGGSMNLDGVLLVKTTAVGEQTALARIIRLVEDAQAKKPSVQKLVDKVSAVFVPTIILIALITLLAWGISTGEWQKALIHAVAVLVIACPCALGLATPTSILVGTGNAARQGILIRDAEILEILPKIKTVAFDKTGTLTEGKPKLVRVEHDYTLSFAAALQQGSEHPLAQATLELAKEKGLAAPEAKSIKRIDGGIQGVIEGSNYTLVAAQGEYLDWQKEGLTVSILKKDNRDLGAFAFQDTVRRESKKAIEALRNRGIQVLLISGDNEETTKSIAHSLKIDEYYARQTPKSKAELIDRRRSQGESIAMVGDGVNDAPALSSATVGFAMGQGTDVAMQSAAVTLLGNHPGLVADAIDIAQKTLSKIKQNLFWAFIYNLIGIPLAAMGKLSPILAGTAMALSSICVVVNSLLLKNWKKS